MKQLRFKSKEAIKKEIRRWLDNDHESNLHQRINNRGIMGENHLRVMGYSGEQIKEITSREEKGKFNHFYKRFLKRDRR